jgi:hypothetical protein
VLLKARRERAAKTDQRGRPHDDGGSDVATNEPGDGVLDLGSNTQGGDGDGGGTKKGKGRYRGKRQGRNRKRIEKRRKLGSKDELEHP